MMKHFKKMTFITTAAFLFCLTVASGTISSILLPSITIEAREDAEPTPLPEESDIKPMADDEQDEYSNKTK